VGCLTALRGPRVSRLRPWVSLTQGRRPAAPECAHRQPHSASEMLEVRPSSSATTSLASARRSRCGSCFDCPKSSSPMAPPAPACAEARSHGCMGSAALPHRIAFAMPKKAEPRRKQSSARRSSPPEVQGEWGGGGHGQGAAGGEQLLFEPSPVGARLPNPPSC
jgi:hypothetical protein